MQGLVKFLGSKATGFLGRVYKQGVALVVVFGALVAFLRHLRKLHVILPFCMWLPRFTIAHRVSPHVHSLFHSTIFVKALPDSSFACFFPLFPRFLPSAAGNGDFLAGSWIFSSELKVGFAIVLLLLQLACLQLALAACTHLSASRLP